MQSREVHRGRILALWLFMGSGVKHDARLIGYYLYPYNRMNAGHIPGHAHQRLGIPSVWGIRRGQVVG